VEERERLPAGEPPAPGALPPEIEAELRRRAQMGDAATVTGALPPEVAAELRRRLQMGTAGAATAAPGADEQPRRRGGSGWQERLKRLGPFGIFLAYLFGKLKLVLGLLSQFKFLGLILKFAFVLLKTGGTMLLSIGFYALAWGWQFAAGFVLCILAHEMGHVYVAWRMGVPVTAPIFIPGFGALILQKRAAKSAWDEALIGIGGPVAGTLAGLFCLLLYQFAHSPLLLAIAYTTFLVNLFNLAPIYPLDGGWITGAVSPRLWAVGIVLMVIMLLTGYVRNPLILLLVFFSLPRLIHGLKTGDVTPPGGVPTTPHQRMLMGLSYVGLCAFLFWLMAETHVPHAA
jgi:Zn-dependent protease